MTASLAQFVEIARQLFGDNLPREIALLEAAIQVGNGGDAAALARRARTSARRLQQLAIADDALTVAFGGSLVEVNAAVFARTSSILGQLLLGHIAERAFEEIYQREIGTEQLELEDEREGRTDTDFRVLNGERRSVFRLNIKFHGTLFQKSREMVGLEPEDCFALATYKINQALAKEKAEVLPYVFAVVSVPGLTAQSASETFPDEIVEFVAKVSASKIPQKRKYEETAVKFMFSDEAPPEAALLISQFVDRIKSAPWRLISATRANLILRERLFERVYAVRVRGFARNYRNAELDMHFSLAQDMTPLADFLDLVRQTGLHGVTAYLSRGRV